MSRLTKYCHQQLPGRPKTTKCVLACVHSCVRTRVSLENHRQCLLHRARRCRPGAESSPNSRSWWPTFYYSSSSLAGHLEQLLVISMIATSNRPSIWPYAHLIQFHVLINNCIGNTARRLLWTDTGRDKVDLERNDVARKDKVNKCCVYSISCSTGLDRRWKPDLKLRILVCYRI